MSGAEVHRCDGEGSTLLEGGDSQSAVTRSDSGCCLELVGRGEV
jgi:hypothetical protein